MLICGVIGYKYEAQLTHTWYFMDISAQFLYNAPWMCSCHFNPNISTAVIVNSLGQTLYSTKAFYCSLLVQIFIFKVIIVNLTIFSWIIVLEIKTQPQIRSKLLFKNLRYNSLQEVYSSLGWGGVYEHLYGYMAHQQ